MCGQAGRFVTGNDALSHSEKNATDNLLCTYRVGNISSCDKAGRIGSRQRDNADRFNKED